MIDVNNVTMKFKMANDRINSLKEFVVKTVTKKLKYKEFVALKEVSFTINKGEVIGIIGRNGAGKSTLLKVISGILSPTIGKVTVAGSIAPMLELGAGFDIDLTARENVFLNGAVLGYSKQYLTEKYNEIVEFSELSEFMNVPIRNFSSGMIMRLAFAIATLVNPDILIVDEILAVGDAHFQKKSAKRMRELMSGGATVILVSHSIQQIREMCARAIWLDHGEVIMDGPAEEVCDAYTMSIQGIDGNQVQSPMVIEENSEYKERLYSPTCVEKIGDLYFIVDSWHHRAIYHNEFFDPISEWQLLDDDLHNPNSIASDGKYYLISDMANHRINVYQLTEGNFIKTQEFKQVGQSPLKIIYDDVNRRFLCISGDSQEIAVFVSDVDSIRQIALVKVDCLGQSYSRTIRIIDGKCYIISGPGKIMIVNHHDLSFSEIGSISVPFQLVGMNDLYKIGSYFYISVYQNANMDIFPRLIRTKELTSHSLNHYQDIYDILGMKGVPYRFSNFDGRTYLTEIHSYSSIVSFYAQDDEIEHINKLHEYGVPNESSIKRRISKDEY